MFDKGYFYGVGSTYKGGYHRSRHSFKNQVGEIIVKVGRKPSTLLDVGCAFGYLVEDALELEIDAYGVDISRYALSQAPKPNVKGKVALATALHIPFRDGIFEVLTALELVEHVSSPLRTLEEFHRVLKNEGFLFLSTPIPHPFPEGDRTHISVKSPDYWINNLRNIGFEVTPFYHAGPFHRYSGKKWLRVFFSLSPDILARLVEDIASRIVGRFITYRFYKLFLVARKRHGTY